MSLVRKTSVWAVFAAGMLTGVLASLWPSAEPRPAFAADRISLAELEARVEALDEKQAVDDEKLAHVSAFPNGDLLIEGVNLHIRSGSGATDGPVNGAGNLVVGYNEEQPSGAVRTGSHNLVLGSGHSYTSYGGLVAGFRNEISGPYASVTGGAANVASGPWSSVSGGSAGTASGDFSSVSGGAHNTASGFASNVSGGAENAASGDFSSVSSGGGNTASGLGSSVTCGAENIASGKDSSVSGGRRDLASGDFSTIGGGFERTAPGEDDWAAGGLFEDD